MVRVIDKFTVSVVNIAVSFPEFASEKCVMS